VQRARPAVQLGEVPDGCGRSLDPAELALSDAEPAGQLGLRDLGGLNRPVGAEKAPKCRLSRADLISGCSQKSAGSTGATSGAASAAFAHGPHSSARLSAARAVLHDTQRRAGW
jgi:hypothetical protein